MAGFLVPYAATIAGVTTTGVGAFALRWAWRWLTATEPRDVYLVLRGPTDSPATEHELEVWNTGDFPVYLETVQAVDEPQPWMYSYESPPRLAVGARVPLRQSTPLRVDQHYAIYVHDDHRARWRLEYPLDRRLGDPNGAPPARVERQWRATPAGRPRRSLQ